MSTFREAFRVAKNDGKSKFTWQGKSYSTKTAEEQGREVGVKAAAGSGRGMSAGRTAKDEDTAPRRAEPPAAPAGPRRNPEAEAKRSADTTAMMERMKSRAGRGERVSSNEEERDRAMERTLAATSALSGVGAIGAGAQAMKIAKLASAAKSTPKAAPRVEPGVGRPVTSKLDDAAAAFSRPQARQASKDTGYTREPSKTTPPQPTRAPKPRDEVLKRQAAMREGRKATEDYARDVMERGAEMGMKKGGMAKAYAKGGSVKGGGCETRSKKTRYI